MTDAKPEADIAIVLLDLKDEIIADWEKTVLVDVPACKDQPRSVLKDSLPRFLEILSETLATKSHFGELMDISKVHARDRFRLPEYTLGQVLLEYHYLRKTLLKLLPASYEDRIRIHDYLDKAIAEAAEEFHLRCVEEERNAKNKTERAVSQLKGEQAIRQRFVLALTHDLRTPLTSAILAVDTLSVGLLSQKRRDACLLIKRNLKRIDSMIEDLLDTNLIQAGKSLLINCSQIGLFNLAREVIENLTPIYGERFKLKGEEVVGYWDEKYLIRILENLLSNSIKHGHDATPIAIHVGRVGKNAFLSVHNHGPPISENDKKTLFEQFSRGHHTEDKKTIGWGIGLTLVRGAVEAHNGWIKVTSPVCDGTEFKIILPLDSRARGNSPRESEPCP